MKRGAPVVVGGFIVAALALGVAAVVMLAGGRLFRTTYPFVVYFHGSVDGLEPGASVKVRGLTVGKVRAIYFNLSSKPRTGELRMPVVIELEPKKFKARGVNIDFDDSAAFGRIVREQGLRAQLSTPGLITGDRYVSLDLLPATPLDLVGDDSVQYQEIPPAPTDFEGAQKQALGVIERVSRLDVERLFASAQQLVDNANRVVAAPEVMDTLVAVKQSAEHLRDATANLNGAITDLRRIANELAPQGVAIAHDLAAASKTAGRLVDRAQGLVDDARQLVPAGGSFVASAQRALGELTDTLRSVRQLVDQLQRDPGAILRGTP